MKKLIGLVVLLSALVLSSYYGMGVITERTLEKNIEIINQSNGLLVDIVNYNRGWYTSTAVLNWRLHIPERLSKGQNGQSTTVAAQDYNIQMPLTIYHGPVIIADSKVKFGLGYASSDILMPAQYVEQFSTLFTGDSIKPRLNLSLFVNYLNHSELLISLPGFKLITKEGGAKFEWFGMDTHIGVSSTMKNIDGGVTINGASFIKNKMKAILGKVDSSYDMHQTDTGLYLGQANISVPSFVVNESEQKILDLEQLDLQSSSDIEDGLFNTQFTASLNKVVARGKTYGPGILEVSIKNLDALVLAEINEQSNKMQQGTDVERQQALLALLPELPKLFSKGAQLHVSKLSLVVPEGAIEGNLLVSLPKGNIGNPFQLLQKVEGNGAIKVPAAVLKGLLVASAKQNLLSQPTLQQAMVQQMKSDGSANAAPSSAPTVAAPEAANAAKQAPAVAVPAPEVLPPVGQQGQSKPLAVVELEQQAVAQADQKLAAMVQVGLLSRQGTEYVIELNLAQGQLSVNGTPFTPAMIQF